MEDDKLEYSAEAMKEAVSEDKTTFEGTVIWFKSTGHGFIEWQINGVKERDIFVHFSDIISEGFRMLYKGQKVLFQVGLNNRQEPKAIAVKILIGK